MVGATLLVGKIFVLIYLKEFGHKGNTKISTNFEK